MINHRVYTGEDIEHQEVNNDHGQLKQGHPQGDLEDDCVCLEAPTHTLRLHEELNAHASVLQPAESAIRLLEVVVE